MLTGQNGILNRAAEAKEKTEIASKDEQRKLAQVEALMSTGDTEYNGVTIPKGFAPTKVAGEDSIDVGLVITDGSGNEYVWVEVPKTTEIYSTAGINITNFTDKEYAEIEKDLKTYTSEYANSNISDSDTNLKDKYRRMLKSVYTNKGFWIGRYEAGIDGEKPRTTYEMLTNEDKSVIKQDMYPYNYVTRSDAQQLAERMDYKSCTSSLIFGLQWNLTLKYIETKKAWTKEKLIINSMTIGNYYNSEFMLYRGKFAQYGTLSEWNNYDSQEKSSLVIKNKKQSQTSGKNGIFLTTGATEISNLQNIYDIAGNVWEWTLELYNDASLPYVRRGGSGNYKSTDYPAKGFAFNHIGDRGDDTGFRIGLWE